MGVALADVLVNDRWLEFQRLARSKGTLLAPLPPGTTDAGPRSARDFRGKAQLMQHREASLDAGGGGAAGSRGGFMRSFFDEVSKVQNTLRQGRECVLRMDQMMEEVLQATTQDRQRAVHDALGSLADAATGHIAASKRGLEELQERAAREEKQNPSAAERRIRQNMQQALAKKHQQLLVDFQKAQLDFKHVLERRQAREMQLLCPDATPEEVAQMIEAGQTSSQVVMRRMAGAHAGIVEEVQRIYDKHQDILRLEKSIQDLAQMFQEIAVLVDEQGEMLDCIERNVHDTSEYTGGGVKELDKALKIQKNTRKWQCYLSFCGTLVLLVLMWPVLHHFL